MNRDKIRDELAKHADDAALTLIGEFLQAYIDRNPETAEKICDEKENLSGAFGAIRAYAEKHKHGICGCVDDVTGMRLALGYYDVEAGDAEIKSVLRSMYMAQEKTETQESTPEPAGGDLDLDALLGM